MPIITVPTATGTIIKEWSDRASTCIASISAKTGRLSSSLALALRTISTTRGLSGPGLQQETGRVLGGFVAVESIAHGFRSGLRFLSLMMLAIGLAVAVSLAHAAKGLRAPPGSGYT